MDGVEHTYYYMGDKLMRMTVGDSLTMDFVYDQNGQPYSVTHNGMKNYYVLNRQGDVVRIVTSGGASRGIYRYDAWGNILYNTDSTFMNLNPLRYRGYVYDPETELYYCQSRYYDPAVGRFINADAYASTGQGILGNNMFAYCGNNPVLFKDESGTHFRNAITPIQLDSPGSAWDNRLDIGTPSEFAREVDSLISGIIGANSSDELLEYSIVAYPTALSKFGTGLYDIRTGFLLILTPIPSLADELSGIWLIADGFFSIIDSINLIWSEE